MATLEQILEGAYLSPKEKHAVRCKILKKMTIKQIGAAYKPNPSLSRSRWDFLVQGVMSKFIRIFRKLVEEGKVSKKIADMVGDKKSVPLILKHLDEVDIKDWQAACINFLQAKHMALLSDEDYYATDRVRLHLSVRTHNCMGANDIVTVQDICNLGGARILAMANFGEKGLEELREILGERAHEALKI